MSYYRHHLFFCINERQDGRPCCGSHGAKAMRDYLKVQVKQLGLSGPGGVRVSTAGCMDRCDLGPVLVIYPEATWYTYVDRDDIDEILQRHIIEGETVDRLTV